MIKKSNRSYDLIVIGGAPGSGKTTICKLLQQKLESPLIDFGWIREFHLDREWKKADEKEKQMSFENLLFILKNYIKYGYKNVIINDIGDNHALEIMKMFSKNNCLLITLIIEDEELKRRVVGPRDSGFKDFKKAIQWNNELKNRNTIKNEHKINNSHNSPEKTANLIMELIKNG
jgi:adenylate kinase family enzyme